MFRKYIANLPLKNKILAIIIFINIFILFIVSVLGINIIVHTNNQILYQSIAASLSYSSKDVQSFLDNVETMSALMISDDIIQEHLSIIKETNDPMEIRKAYTTLYTKVQNYYSNYKNNHISYISLYSHSFVTHTYTPLAERTPQEITEYLRKSARDKEGAAVWTTSYCSEYGLFLSRDVRRIENLLLDNIGEVIICLDIDSLINESTDFSTQYKESSYLLFDDNDLVYHSKSLTEENAKYIQENLKSPYDVLNIGGHRFFAVKGSLPRFNWDYICLVSYDETHRTIMLSYWIYVFIILGIIIVSIGLSDLLIKLIIKHLDNLIKKMKAFRGHQTELIDEGYNYQERKDELGLLHRQFDQMALEIEELIQQNYINEILMKDAQIKALETQINPHFLYNTLESVNWRAKAIGETQISQMVESLGNLLRITLKDDDENFSLMQELELVKCYLTIQKHRYDDQLYYKISAENTLLDASIPKLTIQPLVENAIRHAVEVSTEVCRIYIEIFLQNKNLVILVKNSGSSFEPDIMDNINSNKIKSRGFGIGLININQRIKLTFGNCYGLSLYNEDGFAIAKITIPYHKIREVEKEIQC